MRSEKDNELIINTAIMILLVSGILNPNYMSTQLFFQEIHQLFANHIKTKSHSTFPFHHLHSVCFELNLHHGRLHH